MDEEAENGAGTPSGEKRDRTTVPGGGSATDRVKGTGVRAVRLKKVTWNP